MGRHKKPETIQRERDRELRKDRIEQKKREKEIRRSEREKKRQKKDLAKQWVEENSKSIIHPSYLSRSCQECGASKDVVTVVQHKKLKRLCLACYGPGDRGKKDFKKRELGQLNLF